MTPCTRSWISSTNTLDDPRRKPLVIPWAPCSRRDSLIEVANGCVEVIRFDDLQHFSLTFALLKLLALSSRPEFYYCFCIRRRGELLDWRPSQ